MYNNNNTHTPFTKTPIKMQSALYLPPPSTLPFYLTSNPTKPFSSSSPKISISKLQTSSFPPLLRATSNLQDTPPSTVDYSSPTSVFPAEACEVVGGEACDAEIYPEVKLKPEDRPARSSTEAVDREYLEYDSPKTVFPGEACDDLGGEFCESEYQQGVFQEK